MKRGVCTPKFFTATFADHSLGVRVVIVAIPSGIPQLSDSFPRYSGNIHTHTPYPRETRVRGIIIVLISVHTSIYRIRPAIVLREVFRRIIYVTGVAK